MVIETRSGDFVKWLSSFVCQLRTAQKFSVFPNLAVFEVRLKEILDSNMAVVVNNIFACFTLSLSTTPS